MSLWDTRDAMRKKAASKKAVPKKAKKKGPTRKAPPPKFDVPEAFPAGVPVGERKPVKKRTVPRDERFTVEDLCRCLHPLSYTDDLGVLRIHGPVVCKETDIPEIPFNSLFAEIRVDRNEGTVEVFTHADPSFPRHVLLKALKKTG